MEVSFSVRVDRTFGSLSSSSSSRALTPSLWSLTDEEIEKREWSREASSPMAEGEEEEEDEEESKFDERALPSHFDRQFLKAKGKLLPSPVAENSASVNPNPNPNFGSDDDDEDEDELEDDLRELDEEAGEGTSRDGASREEGDEELEVKSSVGMDSTLDYELDEDDYDKVAVGRENTGVRLYMKDANDYIPHLIYNELPSTFRAAPRDPRANHMAAKLRLKEDAEAAKSFGALHVSDLTMTAASHAPINPSNDGDNLKSILKRKEDQMDVKSEKRVRFDPSCKSHGEREFRGNKNASAVTSDGEDNLHKEAPSELQTSLVPDYVRNPSKYTHYTFDSLDDVNEESNRQACMDFLDMIRKSKKAADEAPADLLKPVIFNPKKKADTPMAINRYESDGHGKRVPLRISAEDTHEDEASEMEVDEQADVTVKPTSGKKPSRQYRSKKNMESGESDSCSMLNEQSLPKQQVSHRSIRKFYYTVYMPCSSC